MISLKVYRGFQLKTEEQKTISRQSILNDAILKWDILSSKTEQSTEWMWSVNLPLVGRYMPISSKGKGKWQAVWINICYS